MDLPTPILLALGLFGVIAANILYVMCTAAAPQNDEEQALDDAEQVEYLRKHG